jgi:hypothetical protein
MLLSRLFPACVGTSLGYSWLTFIGVVSGSENRCFSTHKLLSI